MNWILDADIRSFFDEISQQWLIRFLEHRIGDRRIIRLIQKWRADKVGQRVNGDQGGGSGHPSARMPRVLRWARALPSPRTLLLRRDLATVDDQAVTLSSALATNGAMPQSRATAALAGRRQFFIHLVGVSK